MADPKPTTEAQPPRHPDFKSTEASRPPFNTNSHFHFTQPPSPSWTPGSGANNPRPSQTYTHREIDPDDPNRPAVHNYKLLISAVVPRPVGFVSTVSEDGQSTNLAPFSYFNLVCHDPPMFVLGFSGGYNRPKDTLANLLATRECVLNIISEDYIEAANYTSINAPEGVSEWPFSGLTPAKSRLVKPDRVKEAVFSVEAKLVESREWESRVTKGKKTGVMCVVEGVRFWAREDAVDEQGLLIDPAVLRPISRLGGISYARVTEAFELPRPDFDEVTKDPEVAKLVKPKADGQ